MAAESGDRWPRSDSRISVIVRTIGSHPHRLGEALESLAAQSIRDFEVVVVDMGGGANDGVLREYEARLPALRRLELARRSRPSALNAGIDAASAPAISLLDDDNLYDREQLAIFLSGLDATAAPYVYTGVRHVTCSPDGERLTCRDVSRPFDFEDLILGNFIYATGSAFRKSLWSALGGYDERFDVFEDWDFLIRAAQTGEIAHLPVVYGESRKFTGRDGESAFHREIDAMRRCHAGIYWKHRHLYLEGRRRTAFRLSFEQHCLRRRPRRRGPLATTIGGWRLELFADLASWLGREWRSGLPSPRTSASTPMAIGTGAGA